MQQLVSLVIQIFLEISESPPANLNDIVAKYLELLR